MKMAREVREALEECGLPWSLERGNRHFKIMVGGRFVGILPLNGKISESSRRATLNIASQIKRAAREIKT